MLLKLVFVGMSVFVFLIGFNSDNQNGINKGANLAVMDVDSIVFKIK